MIIRTLRFMPAAVAATILYCTLTEAANPAPVVIAPPKNSAVISEDTTKWRREPFLAGNKQGDRLMYSKTALPGKLSAIIQKKEPEQEIHLQGIMQADKAFHALINGRSVKVGDHIGGVTIKEISRFKVVVLNESKEKIIYDIYQGRIDRGKQ